MSKSDKHREGGSLISFLGRRRFRITDTHKGDIRADKPVFIEEGATAVGDIFAPQITVSGLLFGTAVAREVKVVSQGQVWGDVLTVRLEVEPGGRIRGWMNEISEAEYTSLSASATIPEVQVASAPSTLPTGVTTAITPTRSEEEKEVLRRLREEAGEALAARAELEAAFEDRVVEVAGERAARAAIVEEELGATKIALETAEQENVAFSAELDNLKQQLAQQREALNAGRDEQLESNRKVDELGDMIAERDQEIIQLQAAQTETETRLQDRRQQIEHLNGRVESLEAALQASLQTETEQEQSLLRWQELAEVTQQQVSALEKELASWKEQATADPAEVASLRKHLQQSDEQLHQALAELQAKDLEFATLQEQHVLLRQNWEEANAELDAFRERQTDSLSKRSSSRGANEETARLEAEVAKTKQSAQTSQQQLSWLKAEHEKILSELAEARNRAGEDEARINRLEATLAETQALLMERELSLQEAEATAAEQVAALKVKMKEQARLIRRMKQVTDERIQELEQRLTDDT